MPEAASDPDWVQSLANSHQKLFQNFKIGLTLERLPEYEHED